ncbi:MAG: helix-turn-helix transcriptional regulator [Acidimicrobiia bacterium]
MRRRAHLSIRQLADRAGVAASTVSRIEAGAVSPTIETLEKLAAACDAKLAIEARDSKAPSLASLARAWRWGPDEAVRPDWTTIRSLLDHLAQHPEESAQAIQEAPAASGSDVMDNLLAALAETISDEIGQPAPGWTTQVRPPLEEWAPPGTPLMHKRARATTPPRFAARRLLVGRDSLWRPSELVHG